jgi:hypothetical protein
MKTEFLSETLVKKLILDVSVTNRTRRNRLRIDYEDFGVFRNNYGRVSFINDSMFGLVLSHRIYERMDQSYNNSGHFITHKSIIKPLVLSQLQYSLLILEL